MLSGSLSDYLTSASDDSVAHIIDVSTSHHAFVEYGARNLDGEAEQTFIECCECLVQSV